MGSYEKTIILRFMAFNGLMKMDRGFNLHQWDTEVILKQDQ